MKGFDRDILARWSIPGAVATIIALSSPATPAAVVTVRLTTALSAAYEGPRLPETWAVPVQEPPRLDGRLDDKAWTAAQAVVLGRLDRDAETAPRTEARFLHAGSVLYVGCELSEPRIDQLRRTVKQPDGPAHQDDSIELFLAPKGSQGYFQFIVSAGGAIFDRRGNGDPAAWNSGAKVAVAVGEKGWSLEVAIPMAAMGVADAPLDRWRVNVYRNRQAGREGNLQAWSPTCSDDYDVPERFGVLRFGSPPLRKPQPPPPGESPGIVVEDLGDQGAVLRFDLARIPKDAKIYRAHLLCQRRPHDGRMEEYLKPIEIYPLAAAHQRGSAPAAAGRPLELVRPSLQAFDMTDAVRGWLSGKGRPELYVKVFPGWKKHATCLDIACEGQPANVPAQAKGLRAVHRAGQTFLTWDDPEDTFGTGPVTWGALGDYRRRIDPERQVRYRLYRHARPIDARNIHDAVLLAEVEPLSGFNSNSWSLERLIHQTVFSNEDRGELGVYGPFKDWNINSPQGGRLTIPRLAIEDGKALPARTALYVHSAAAAQRVYYAVTAVARGVENLADFSRANSLDQPVPETPAAWEPVEQPVAEPFAFDFRGRRRYFVTWVATPLAPRPMYFNWSVLVPPDLKASAPVELYFHAPGYSYARPPVKFLDRSIQICPHDFPFSGWYGYNDAMDTLQSPVGDMVRPYTVRRIEAFLTWAQGRFPVDASRIIAVGGDGAALMALQRPQLFAYVLVTGFEAQQLDPKAAPRYVRAWGPPSPNIRSENGLAEWTWAELDWLLCGQRLPAVIPKDVSHPTAVPSAPGDGPGFRINENGTISLIAATDPGSRKSAAAPALGLKTELPLWVCRGPSWGRNPQYGHGRGRFYYALQATRHALHAHWAWGGRLTAPEKFSGLWQGLDIQNTTPVPVILNSSLDREGEGSGQTNASYRWSDVQEDQRRFEITIAGPASTFDLVPRRLSKFTIRPGERFAWEAEAVEVPDWSRAKKPAARSGVATADADGLVLLQGLELVRGYALKIRITRAK